MSIALIAPISGWPHASTSVRRLSRTTTNDNSAPATRAEVFADTPLQFGRGAHRQPHPVRNTVLGLLMIGAGVAGGAALATQFPAPGLSNNQRPHTVQLSPEETGNCTTSNTTKATTSPHNLLPMVTCTYHHPLKDLTALQQLSDKLKQHNGIGDKQGTTAFFSTDPQLKGAIVISDSNPTQENRHTLVHSDFYAMYTILPNGMVTLTAPNRSTDGDSNRAFSVSEPQVMQRIATLIQTLLAVP